MNYNILTYAVYIPATIALCIWTAKSLHKNTKAFLMQKFHQQEDLASSTNNLIQTGFYLLALGFSFMYMRIKDFEHDTAAGYISNNLLGNSQETLETLAGKLGTYTFTLGVLFFLNFLIMLKVHAPKNKQIVYDEK